MIGPMSTKLEQQTMSKIDGRDLAPINPSILIGDKQRAYEEDHLNYRNKEEDLINQATMAEKAKMDESLGSTALIPVKLEAKIDELRAMK